MNILPVGFTYATYGGMTSTGVTLFSIFKSSTASKEIDPKYETLNLQINNQRKLLEELLEYSNKYTNY